MNPDRWHLLNRLCITLVCAVVMSLVVYVLSFGPAQYFWAKRICKTMHREDGFAGEMTCNPLFNPVIAFVDHTPLKTPLYRYIGWWEDAGRNAAYDETDRLARTSGSAQK